MGVFVNDDRHVMAKHSTICPSQEELEAVQNMVSLTERSLKAVSDWLEEQERGTQLESKGDEQKDGDSKTAEQTTRSLRGVMRVMRVGLVAKGLLLKDDLDLELVLLCKDKPTGTLLRKVAENLTSQLKTITEEKYEVTPLVRDASIVIKNAKQPPLTLSIHLTSPVVREEAEKLSAGETLSVNDPPDVLDRQKCLAALTSLRHAKWFQTRAIGLRSCVIVIRILRDLCARDPIWAPLRGWPLELLCEKAIGTVNRPMAAGEALRRFLECLASGILMGDGSGICDPCEKDPCDAISHLDVQQREDITQSAQHALRLSAFGQLHKVLGMDPLPSKLPKKQRSETPIDYTAPDEKSEPPQGMNALTCLSQLKPGLHYKLISQTGPVHVPVFTVAVEVDGKTFKSSGPSKRIAKLHVAVKVLQDMGLPTGVEQKVAEPVKTLEVTPTITEKPQPAKTELGASVSMTNVGPPENTEVSQHASNMRVHLGDIIPDRWRPSLITTAISAVDKQRACRNCTTVGQRPRGGNQVGSQKEKRKVKSVGLRVATLNVGTMTGEVGELADMMQRRKVDILCVQETKWKGSKAHNIGPGFKVIYHGVDDKRNGVGVILKEELAKNVGEVKRVSDRVMCLKVKVEDLILNVVSGHAPQVGCEEKEKGKFYKDLDEVMMNIPREERVVIGADLNGHVGEGNSGDEDVIGRFGVKERNQEGQMVVDFAKRMDMAVVNTYFQKREEHKVTYKSGEMSTQVDYILCRRRNLKEIGDCKVVAGENVARPHRMVVCRMTCCDEEKKSQSKEGDKMMAVEE